MALSFSKVNIRSQDGEASQTINFKPGATKTLFEVQTIANISADEKSSAPVNELIEQNPLYADFKNDIMVIASGKTVNFFSFNLGPKLIYSYSIEGSALICGISWLPSVEVVLLVLSDGQFVLCAPIYNVAKSKTEVLESCTPNCRISYAFINGECIFCIAEENGTAHFVQLIDYEDISSTINKQRRFGELVTQAAQSFNFLCSAKTKSPLIAPILTGFVSFPLHAADNIEFCELDCNGNNTHLTFHGCLSSGNSNFTTVRRVGAFIVTLDDNRHLRFWDRLTMVEIYDMTLEGISEIITFEFLDVESDEICLDDVKLLLHVRTEKGYELQIRMLTTLEVIYSVKTSGQILVMSESTDADNAIVFVDTNWDKATLTLRFIIEAQPEMRLQRLLKRGLYDDAEVFAKTYNLDVQQVYIARINDLIDQVSEPDEDSIFLQVIKYCDLVVDDNTVGEICIAGALKSHVYDGVVGFLAYAGKRSITDISTKQELDKYHYALTSYRMIYGPSPNFGTNSHWLLFIAGGSFTELFDGFCHTGKINEARIIWQRYPSFIREHLGSVVNLQAIMDKFYEAILANRGIVNAIIEFLEYELIPCSLFHCFEDLSNANAIQTTINVFIEFITRIARCLEGLCPESFPQNSLHVVSTLQRSLKLMMNSQVTPDTQAKVLLIFARVAVNSRNPDEPMGALNLFEERLHKLVRLYQIYHCRLSYDDYLVQTKESICFLILERVHAVHLVKEHVEKFAIPYMKENNLKKDDTLYTYICKVAQYGASIKAQTNPWDELCLTICQTISNAQLKCKAVIDIAKRALPPWSTQLTEMVKKMINSTGIDVSLIDELRRQCFLADLGQILLSYRIPVDKRHEVHNINLLKGLLCYIFRSQEKSTIAKLEDSFKIVELVKKLGVSNVPTQIECYQLYAMRAIIETMPTHVEEIEMQSLINFMENIKSKEIREAVSKALVLNLEFMIDGKEYSFGKVLPRKRLIMISAVLCILERFLPSSEEHIAKIQLLRSIRKLQIEYGLFITILEFYSTEKRISYFENFLKNKSGKAVISEAVNFGNLLHFDPFTSYQTFIKLNTNDSIKIISALNKLLRNNVILKEEQLRFAIDTTSLVLENVSQLAEKNDTTDIIQIIKELKSISILLAFSSSKCLTSDQEAETFVFRLYGYLSLFDQLLDQCIKEEDSHEKLEVDGSENSSKYMKLHGKIYEISNRIGTFMPRNEGHVFETNQAVQFFANVVLSILPANKNSPSIDEFNQHMLENWSSLFDFLNVQNQTLLEIMARNFAKNLDCFAKAQEFAIGNPQQSVCNMCQKILTEPVADLWLAAYLILSLESKDIPKLLNTLRHWCKNKKNVRINLNLIRLTQFILINLKDQNYMKKINEWFTTTHWQKTMGKYGIILPANIPMEKLMLDFVREQLPPSILKQYCIDFKLNVNEILLEYGIALCYKAALETSQEKCESTLDVAATALLEVTKADGLFNQIFEVLQKICPYSYEVIGLLVNRMKESSATEKDQQIVSDCYVVLKFLNLFNRQNGFTAQELKWYKNFMKDSIPEDRVPTPEPSETSMHETSSRPSLAAMKELYDQTKIAPSDLPPSATTRLPFHVFFFMDKKSIEEILVPIVNNELNIYNVQDWTAAIECCKYFMKLSRTILLICAISNKINETVARDCDLEDSDLEIIRELLMEANPGSRTILLQGLATNFKALTLCKTKLVVLRLGLQVTKIWLENEKTDESVQEKLASFSNILSTALCQYTTHFILSENGLLNSVTMDLSCRPIELLQHICVAETNWSEPSDIELKMKICEEIAQANESDLNEVNEKLINIWLPGVEQPVIYSDPNATFEFGEVVGSSENIEKELVISIPYMDPSISRIVHILRARDPQSVARILVQKLDEDVNKLPGGYNTKLRIICCLIRSLSEEQLREYIQVDYCAIFSQLINMLNERILAISNVDISRKDLSKMSPIDFVRSLVSPQSPYRQTLENAYLAMCLLIDNNSADISLVEKVLRRIQGQNMKMLKAILKYARTLPNIEAISNLPIYYSRFVDSQLQDLELTKENSAEIHSLIFFLLGCPVEGRHHFNIVNQRLISLNVPILSSLITLSANPTATLPQKDMVNVSEIDIDIQWRPETSLSEPKP